MGRSTRRFVPSLLAVAGAVMLCSGLVSTVDAFTKPGWGYCTRTGAGCVSSCWGNCVANWAVGNCDCVPMWSYGDPQETLDPRE